MTAVIEHLPNNGDNEVPDKNVFKKELLSVLKPLNLIQALYILSMYKIRDGCITPNTLFYNVVSGIWSLLLLIGYFFLMFKNIFTADLEGFNFVKCSSNIPTYLLYCFGNVTIYWTNVKQRHNNVRLAISIQNICEMLKENGQILKNFTIFNWVYVIALIGYRVYWTINLNNAFSLVFHFNETIVHLFYIIYDINLLYCVRLMKLLSEALRVWVDDAQKVLNVAEAENELYWNRKFKMYMEIVTTYVIVRSTFQKLILYYCIDTFSYSVISIWLLIEIEKLVGASMLKVALSCIYLIWMVKNLLMVTALCLECERFYTIMEKLRSTCIQLTTTSTCSEAQKRVCKNIQRIQTATFKKMSAWGLFVVDGALPLLLCGLLTTYIIVVLQFEFL